MPQVRRVFKKKSKKSKMKKFLQIAEVTRKREAPDFDLSRQKVDVIVQDEFIAKDI